MKALGCSFKQPYEKADSELRLKIYVIFCAFSFLLFNSKHRIDMREREAMLFVDFCPPKQIHSLYTCEFQNYTIKANVGRFYVLNIYVYYEANLIASSTLAGLRQLPVTNLRLIYYKIN